jgi:ubiquinone/menaquinone biosynthesis C-methylase UbiE
MWEIFASRCAKFVHLDTSHSQERYMRTLQSEVTTGARWLDIGCGRQIVPSWASPLSEQETLVRRASLFAGIDTDHALVEHPLLRCRVVAIGQHLPFRDKSFNLITANMVFEHLEYPAEILREVHRVLSPGGKLIFHTPNLHYPYIFLASLVSDSIKKPLIRLLEQREEQDVFKTYYHSNTVKTIEDLAAAGGFGVDGIQVGGSVGTFQRLGPLAAAEVFFLKMLSLGWCKRFNATITAVLTKLPGEGYAGAPAASATVRS